MTVKRLRRKLIIFTVKLIVWVVAAGIGANYLSRCSSEKKVINNQHSRPKTEIGSEQNDSDLDTSVNDQNVNVDQ